MTETNLIYSEITKDGQTYYEVTGSSEEAPTEVKIPANHNGSPVTSIMTRAFAYCSSLASVTFEEGSKLTSIGDGAFYNCSSLMSIMIPDSVTDIGSDAFGYCNLVSVTIPDSVTSIGNNAFNNCPIEEATIPALAISYIPQNNLKNVVITSGESLGGSAFSNCQSLTSVTFGDNSQLTRIDVSAFEECSSLTNITIPDSVKSIEDDAFSRCSGLTSITFSESSQLTSIGMGAFSGCDSLTSIIIPNSVTSIGDWTFSGCTSLTSITIPSSVTNINQAIFSGCGSLESITLPFVGGSKDAANASNSTLFGYIFGTSSYTGGTATTQYYSPSSYTTTYYIPSRLKSVTITGGKIFYGAFSYCRNLETIITSNNVESISKNAFLGCTGVKTLVISKNIDNITEDTFNGLPEDINIYYGGSEADWLNASSEHIQENKIEHFDLAFYPFKTVYGLNTKTEYKNSFKYTTENLEKIRADLALNKTIAHNIIQPVVGQDDKDIACIKNYLKLKARVTTTKKVTLIEEAEILNNIYTAIYTNFNARQIDFGEEIPYETLLSVLKNADYRIKEVTLDEPVLSTKFSLLDGSEEALGNAAETKNRGNMLYNKLVRRNVLAGKISAFKYDEDFISEYDKTSYAGYNSVYPDPASGTAKITKIESQFDVGTAFDNRPATETDGYVLKENEVIQFRVPNFKTTRTYPAYVNYFIKLNSTSGDGAIAATFETLGNFLEDKWESILDKTNGVTAIRNVVTQETTTIDSLDKFNEVEALHGALFTKEGEGQDAVYTKADTYTASTAYYYVPLKPLKGQQSIFWALNNWIKAQNGLHGQPLTGIYHTVGVQELPFGRFIDEAHYKYLPAYNFGNLSSDRDALNNFYVQVTHDPDSVDVKDKKYTADGLGQDATYKGVPKDGEYQLATGEYLLINYTDSKTDDTGVEQKTVINKVYSEGDIIRANFELIDSALYHNNHSYSKRDGFSFAGQTPEGMFTLGTNEQIEIRDIVQVDLDKEGTYLYWTLNSDDPDALSNSFIFDENYGSGTNNAYTLKEGEHLYYTNSKKQDLVYYGSGTLIVKSTPNLELRKYTSNGEVSEEDIMTYGLAANIPWQPFSFDKTKKLTIIENQYISLTEGDIISKIDGSAPVKAETMLDGSWNNWKQVKNPVETKYRLAEDEVISHLPSLVVSGINWSVRSRLDFNMSKTTAQPLHRGDSLKITFNNGSTQPLEPTAAAGHIPVYVNSNYTCQAAVDTLDATKLLESSLELKLKVSSQSSPTISDNEDLTLNNYINGEAKYTKFDFENLPADHGSGPAFSLNISIPKNDFGLIALYYSKDTAETATNGAYIKAKNGDTDISGLEFFNTGDTKAATKTLKAGLNIIKLSPEVKQLEVYADAAKKSTVIFGNLDIVTDINPKLDYRITDDKESEGAAKPELAQLLKDIKNSGVAKDFYYNVPIQRSNEIDLNPAIESDKLSSPLAWYDPNNVNRKFVISEIDADYLSTGITLTKASRV